MVKLNRRQFIQALGATAAAAVLAKFPEIPEKSKYSQYGEWDSTTFVTGGVLTMDMIEEAAKKARENFGQPEQLLFVNITEEEWAKIVAQFPEAQKAVVV